MRPLLRRRAFRHGQAGPPLLRGADRPRLESAAAIWTDIAELCFDALRAEGAFVRADARIGGVRRQVLVAIFAIGSKRERHGSSVLPQAAGPPWASSPRLKLICAKQSRYSAGVMPVWRLKSSRKKARSS